MTPHRDDFALDGKSVSKGDIDNLLQAAGFSKSNPYYIVPQGRITTLCNATDAQRLALLKEVAGTRVYEEHRAESAKILEETRIKKAKITELLAFIDERLQELESEEGQLAQFDKIDVQRRAIEMVLYQRELTIIKNQLLELRSDTQADNQTDNQNYGRLVTVQEQLVLDKGALEAMQAQLCDLHEENAARRRRMVELDFIRKNNERLEGTLQGYTDELNQVDEQIARDEASVATVNASHLRQQAECDEVKRDLAAATARHTNLLSQRERVKQFKSAKERSQFLEAEVQAAEDALTQLQHQELTLEEERRSLQMRRDDTASELARRRGHDAQSLQQREAIVERRKQLTQQLRYTVKLSYRIA